MTSLQRLILLFLIAQPASAEEILIADFESSDLSGWQVSGEAFGSGPASGSLPGQMKVEGFSGKGFINSYHGGDDSIGKIMSPPFRIDRNHINFLIGGGGFANETCINLVVDGKTVRTSTGRHTSPGGSETLEWDSWDVSEFKGKSATIEGVDTRKGTWGHITFDHIVQSDTPKVFEAHKEFIANKRYLIWPVDTQTSPLRRVFLRDAKSSHLIFYSDIRLSASPEFWTFTDLAHLQGRSFTLTARLPYSQKSTWEKVQLSDTFPGEEELYQEPLRPQYHFTSRRGWINDPNGLVWKDGTWHLFYQHNPYNHGWHNMHWGHASSRDLFHWTEHPNALFPDDEGYMFSGSGFVVSRDHTSLPLKQSPAIVLAYTAEGTFSNTPGRKAEQALALSDDNGKTFRKFNGNPVLPHEVGGNRDPKIFWHQPSTHWIMPLYLDGNRYGLYRSPDLVKWEKTSEYQIPRDAECPDLFELPVNGNPQQSLWVAWGATGYYALGKFDGITFTPQGETQRHYFGSAYAGQSYDNAPDQRRVHIGWMRDGGAGLAGAPFNLQMTLPMDFTLRDLGKGPRLWIEPSREIIGLRKESQSWNDLTFSQDSLNPFASFRGAHFELEAVIDTNRSTASEFGFRIFGDHLALWQRDSQSFTGAEGPQAPLDGKLHIRIFIDTASMETFVNGTYISRYIRQTAGTYPIRVVATGGEVHFDALKLHQIQSVWKK